MGISRDFKDAEGISYPSVV